MKMPVHQLHMESWDACRAVIAAVRKHECRISVVDYSRRHAVEHRLATISEYLAVNDVDVSQNERGEACCGTTFRNDPEHLAVNEVDVSPDAAAR